MTEAIWRHKLVIGPKHGMIGKMIEDYSLGYTFESENIQDLADTIEKALSQDQIVQPGNDKFENFREKLSVDSFKKAYQSAYLQFIQSEGLYQ
jgi:glycosyltransferase involved in cell wall biosynthesis